ncbi:MAG: UDP-N-acetylmuramate dehydrogenase [Saprospiraceae bacterium]|nr:UDP-N-acetylmuramate dehydrogenase [Saprospiraceae bacterium]
MAYNSSLQSYNTFGVASVCRAFATFDNVESLRALLHQADAPVFILGGGSNVLLPDQFDRWVLHNRIGGIAIIHTSGNAVTVRAGGGVVWHDLVTWAVEQGLGGLENLALIPGTVGASPIQNIGAYGVELVDHFQQLTAYHRANGAIRTFDQDECGFGYRDSIFKRDQKDQWVILTVDFLLNRQPELRLDYGAIRDVLSEAHVQTPGIGDVYRAVVQIRRSKLPDPAQIGNAGSFFKNPVIPTEAFQRLQARFPDIPGYPVDDSDTKIPAGWLIDQAGWKGVRRGPCGVHDRQALVLVNHGGATARQICALAEEIQADIQQQYGVDLVQEVNILE